MIRQAVHLRPEWPTPISCAAIDALARDVRRLAEQIAITAAPSYERGRPVDHRWAAVMRLLDDQRTLTAGEAAKAMGVSLEALQPVLMKMTRRGLLQAEAAKKGARQARLSLTSHGKLEAERLVPLYDAIDSLVSFLLAVHAPDLGRQLRSLVEALEAEPFEAQLQERLRLANTPRP